MKYLIPLLAILFFSCKKKADDPRPITKQEPTRVKVAVVFFASNPSDSISKLRVTINGESNWVTERNQVGGKPIERQLAVGDSINVSSQEWRTFMLFAEVEGKMQQIGEKYEYGVGYKAK
jgi:hypothetical protein